MRPILRGTLLSILLVLGVMVGALTTTVPARATTGGCYGASCNGQDPSGRCDDGITVAAMGVTYGMLELRYSPSCKSNWGRYTPYGKDAAGWFAQRTGIWVRVTTWNPGGPSYQTAHHSLALVAGSSWSQMTDGRPTACTGVEVYLSKPNGNIESQGWNWGPCV